MARAILCPVCNGKGVIYGIAGSEANRSIPCHGCHGKGWVEVALDNTERGQRSILFNRCPFCGGDRNQPAGTGCPMGSHYGAYSSE